MAAVRHSGGRAGREHVFEVANNEPGCHANFTAEIAANALNVSPVSCRT